MFLRLHGIRTHQWNLNLGDHGTSRMIDDDAAQFGAFRTQNQAISLSAYRRRAVVSFNAVFGTGHSQEH